MTRVASAEAPAAVRTAADGRALVVVAPGRAELLPFARRAPGPGEIEVRLEGCGVCGSNVPVWEGRPWFTYPLPPGQPGHEGWGIVERVGEGVRAPSVGERVALLAGASFATHDVTPADQAVPLPCDLDAPFPGEAVGCAMNVFRRSRISRGNTVAVVGVGFLGAVVVQLAARAGAHVIALSRRPFALEIARCMGAHETLLTEDLRRDVERVRELTGGLCDVVVEAAGHQSALDLASELVRVRGRLVVAGYHQDGPRAVNMQLWNWRGIDVINAHERDPGAYVEGMRDAVRAVFGGGLDIAPLLTHVVPLEEAARALELTRTRPPGFMKALVTP